MVLAFVWHWRRALEGWRRGRHLHGWATIGFRIVGNTIRGDARTYIVTEPLQVPSNITIVGNTFGPTVLRVRP